MKKNILLYFFLLLISAVAFAEESHGAHEGGIPKVVYYQALNFFTLIAILAYILKSKVSSFFTKRYDTLKAAIQESRRLKDEAEKRHQEYSVKLQKLENEMSHSLEKIQSEGEIIKKKIIQEAQKAAIIIESETKKTIDVELERAKKLLFEEALNQSLSNARDLMSKNVGATDQQRLQKEFVDKVEAMK
jgi:F-type H+-transporting ATPase subunit b